MADAKARNKVCSRVSMDLPPASRVPHRATLLSWWFGKPLRQPSVLFVPLVCRTRGLKAGALRLHARRLGLEGLPPPLHERPIHGVIHRWYSLWDLERPLPPPAWCLAAGVEAPFQPRDVGFHLRVQRGIIDWRGVWGTRRRRDSRRLEATPPHGPVIGLQPPT
jgi:hypothetical protein